MLLPLLVQTAFALPVPELPGPVRTDLRQTGCDGSEVVHTRTRESDFDNDGQFDFGTQTTFRYDAFGNRVLDLHVDSSSTSRTERTFDADQREVRSVLTYDEGSDGTIEDTEVQETTYDAAGRVLSFRSEYTPSVGDSAVSQTDFTYDAGGNLIQSSSSIDNDNDGTADFAIATLYVYSGSVVLLTTRTTDIGGDGSIDSVTLTTYSYDSNNRLLSETERSDIDNDGSDDSINVVFHAYDGQGQLISTIYQSDYQGDSIFDYRQEDAFTYDANGNETLSTSTFDNDNDGTLDFMRSRASTYDASGNRIVDDQTVDNGADGTIDQRNLIQSTYDDAGQALLIVEELTFPQGGPVGTTTTYSLTWSEAGTRLTRREERDEGQDGIIDQVTVEQQLVEDLRTNATRGFEEEVLGMPLGGSEATLGALLTSAVAALEQGNASLALRSVIAFDVLTSSLEGSGHITPEESAELRAPAAALIELYLTTCFAFEE